MIEERAAARAVVERPAERVLHKTGLVLRRRDLPQLLEAEPELRRLAVAIEPEAGDDLCGELSARAFGQQRVLATQLHAACERRLRLTVFADPHVARGHTRDLA